MALSEQDIRDIEERLKPGSGVSDEERSALLEAKAAYENEHLGGWAKAGPSPVANQTPAPGKLGVTGIIGQDAPAPPSPDDEYGPIAAQTDPRFDLVPQGLALQPATTDPRGDREAAEKWRAGASDGPVTVVYEPPVGLVRKQLLENPGLVRMLRSSSPPSIEEINGLTADSELYKDTANWMWRQTAEAATAAGRTVYRYAQAPWLQDEESSSKLATLGLKVGGAMQPLLAAKDAFVMGADDMAAFGAARAAQETAQPKRKLPVPGNTDVMGLNEQVPQDTAQMNQWTREDHPTAYAAGQVLGALAPWGASNWFFQAIGEGGGRLAAAAAKTRLGGAVVEHAPGWLKTAAGIGADTATGTAAAMGTQAGQEGVDMAAKSVQTGEVPTGDRLAEAAERVTDVGADAWKYAGGVASGARLAQAGANTIRDADRLGMGAVGRTESNMNWGPSTMFTGPRLSGETKDLVRQANRERHAPGDYIAEKIAPPIQQKAAERVKVAKGRAASERANYYETPEGQAQLPVTNLQRMSLEKLREHHQPQPAGGAPRPVDDKFRPAQKVFNRHIDDVSTEPIQGGIEISADEAGSFLDARQRYRLLKNDIESANQGAPKAAEKIDRDSYLKTIKDKRARDAADEEIEASIEDIVGDNPSAGAIEKAEQQVLRELVDEAAFVDAHGSLGDYLRQRGKETVYIKPRGYDAKRTETLIKGLGDEDLAEAAKLDRQGRPLAGQKGGWDERRKAQDENVAQAERVQQSIAPKEDAFRSVALQAEMRPADKQHADMLRSLADDAGVRPDLDKLRSLLDAQNLQRQAWFRSPKGADHAIGQRGIDAALLHTFPVLRMLEPNSLLAQRAGQAANLGRREDEEARFASEDSARAKYIRAREKRLKEISEEKAQARQKRKDRWQEKHRE